MGKVEKNLDHGKNKIVGGIKEATGKITGNETLELKGKMQSAKADLKRSMTGPTRLDNVKENIAGSINNRLDKNERNDTKRK